MMDSLSDSLLAAVTETSFYGPSSVPIAGEQESDHSCDNGCLEKPLKPLAELHLPPAIVACYQRAGVSHLFAWQAECLLKASGSVNSLGKRNFVFSAPGQLTSIDLVRFSASGFSSLGGQDHRLRITADQVHSRNETESSLH